MRLQRLATTSIARGTLRKRRKGLKRLGLHRTDIIDTPVTAYPLTRDRAEWLHGATRAAGLLWTSRQDDAARAVASFGDRLSASVLKIEVDREPLCEDEYLDALLELAEQDEAIRFAIPGRARAHFRSIS